MNRKLRLASPQRREGPIRIYHSSRGADLQTTDMIGRIVVTGVSGMINSKSVVVVVIISSDKVYLICVNSFLSGGAHKGGYFQQNNQHGGNFKPYTRVIVKNMCYETSWKVLKDHMRKCGEVIRADLMHDEKGRSRGIG
jgi:hypothetical protein